MFTYRVGLVAALAFCFVTSLAAQESTAPAAGTDPVAAVKQSLQKSMAELRQYQWVETTVVSVKGEEKSRSQNSCYYGADGKVEKTAIGAPPESGGKKPRGLRGKVVEKKTEEMSASMKEAVALVKQYIPPDPALIETAKQAGRVSMTQPDSKGHVNVVIKDYLKAGDSLTVGLNSGTNQLSGISVATFTEKEKDTVGLNVALGNFADGTIYPATIDLQVTAQKLAVAIENSGYKKVGG
jgi:hypothetical protein